MYKIPESKSKKEEKNPLEMWSGVDLKTENRFLYPQREVEKQARRNNVLYTLVCGGIKANIPAFQYGWFTDSSIESSHKWQLHTGSQNTKLQKESIYLNNRLNKICYSLLILYSNQQ